MSKVTNYFSASRRIENIGLRALVERLPEDRSFQIREYRKWLHGQTPHGAVAHLKNMELIEKDISERNHSPRSWKTTKIHRQLLDYWLRDYVDPVQ